MNDGFLRLISGFALISFLSVSPAIAGGRMTKIAVLVREADEVFAQAQNIVAGTPTTRMDASLLAAPDGIGGKFYSNERDFQRAINEIPPTGEMISQFSQGVIRLGQFDNFVHGAVVEALASCDEVTARGQLRVAQQILGELHRIVRGKVNPSWDPPSLEDIPSTSSSCQ